MHVPPPETPALRPQQPLRPRLQPARVARLGVHDVDDEHRDRLRDHAGRLPPWAPRERPPRGRRARQRRHFRRLCVLHRLQRHEEDGQGSVREPLRALPKAPAPPETVARRKKTLFQSPREQFEERIHLLHQDESAPLEAKLVEMRVMFRPSPIGKGVEEPRTYPERLDTFAESKSLRGKSTSMPWIY